MECLHQLDCSRPADSFLRTVRSKVRATSRQGSPTRISTCFARKIIAANLTLTDKEAEQFWPVYDQYTNELVKINDQKYAAIKEYANSLDSLTDEQAMKLTKQALSVDESVAELRLRYVPIFAKVFSGRKTAKFMQLDRRLVMMIDLQVASIIPLVAS